MDARLTESRLPNRSTFMSFDGSWEPLASLITRLHCLESLDFSALGPFPAALQESLSHHPSCQLNVWAVHSIGCSEMTRDRDPYSICRLLRCSNLHTLTIDTTWRSSTLPGWANLTNQLPFIFVAPRLKNLVLHAHQGHKYQYDPKWESFKSTWRDLAARFEHAPVPVLDTLTLDGAHESLLVKLTEAVNLSCLRTLDIHTYREVEGLREVAVAFPGLQQLLITVNPLHWSESDNSDSQEAVSAIALFPQLKFLSLRGLRQASSVFDVLQRHGRSLRGLILEPVPDSNKTRYWYPKFTPPEIIQLAGVCPHLEDLQIQCLRSNGNKAECDFYRALGHFQSLRKVVLDLDCTVNQDTPEATTAATENEIQLIKDGFINATVDTKLALQIFSLITMNQPSGRMRKLRLAPFRLHASELDTLQHNHFLAKQVLVSRFPLGVEEVAKQEWEAFHDMIEPSPRSLPGWLETVLDETLPFVPGREPWWDRYESAPLDMDGV